MKRAMAVLIMAVLALAGCGGGAKGDGKTIRLRYWGDSDEIAVIQGLMRDFEAKHPGVTVKDERKVQSGTGYAEVLVNEFAAGTAPDVIFCVAEIKDLLSDKGLLTDLEPFLAKDKEVRKSDYEPNIIKRFSSGGKLRVLPRDIAPFACIYYNKTLFKKAGVAFPKDDWNWDGFLKACRAVAALKDPQGGRIFGFGDDWTMLDGWILSAGGKAVDDYDKPSRLTMDSPASLKGLLFRWDLMYTHKVMPTPGDNQALSGGNQALFENGHLGMFYSGVWKVPALRHIKDFELDFAMFPKGPQGKRGFGTGGSGYGIRQGAANPELAWELVRYLAGPEGQAKLAATGLLQPAISKLAASKVFLDGKGPGNKAMLLKAATYGQHPPATSLWLTIDGDVLGPVLGRIWVPGFKREEVEKTVKEAVRIANEKHFKVR